MLVPVTSEHTVRIVVSVAGIQVSNDEKLQYDGLRDVVVANGMV